MEEFKIISIPTSSTDEEVQEKQKETSYRKDDSNPPKRRFLGIILLVGLVVASIFVIHIITKYTDFETQNSWERKDSTETQFIEFENNLLKYSSDGVFYTAFNGNLIWNYTYNMNSPQIDVCEKYVIIYDKKGTEIDIFTTSGYVNSIQTNNPIMDAQVASQGTVATLLQESGISYIQLYDTETTLLASGEIHPENGGFPISIALSSSAKKMMLSVINLNSGQLSTDIIVYDFSKEGKKEDDNIISKMTYDDAIMPQIEFLKGDKAVAFGDTKIVLFDNNKKSSVVKEILLSEQMNCIIYNDSYFGYVVETANETGELQNQVEIYNLHGFRTLKKKIDQSYETIDFLRNNEIVVNNNGLIQIYNIQGFKKFEYDFKEPIYKIIPGGTIHRYYLIKPNITDEIHIK